MSDFRFVEQTSLIFSDAPASAAALLRDLKRLLDAGAITQAEYEDEKDRILLRYGISIPRAGAKAEKENVFEEFDDE